MQGEDLYDAYGQTDSGRYVLVVFIYKERELNNYGIQSRPDGTAA
ncbi:MAG: hypothetical protein ACL93V_16705 [Candidatus Electrothrix sp. YB6]